MSLQSLQWTLMISGMPLKAVFRALSCNACVWTSWPTTMHETNACDRVTLQKCSTADVKICQQLAQHAEQAFGGLESRCIRSATRERRLVRVDMGEIARAREWATAASPSSHELSRDGGESRMAAGLDALSGVLDISATERRVRVFVPSG